MHRICALNDSEKVHREEKSKEKEGDYATNRYFLLRKINTLSSSLCVALYRYYMYENKLLILRAKRQSTLAQKGYSP